MYPDPFTAVDLADLTATTFIDDVDFHDEIDSTNTRAAAARHRGLASTTAPRSSCSPTIKPPAAAAARTSGGPPAAHSPSPCSSARTKLELPTDRWPLVSLTAGLAVCAAPWNRSTTISLPKSNGPTTSTSPAARVGGILIEAATGEPPQHHHRHRPQHQQLRRSPPRPNSAKKSPPSATRCRSNAAEPTCSLICCKNWPRDSANFRRTQPDFKTALLPSFAAHWPHRRDRTPHPPHHWPLLRHRR